MRRLLATLLLFMTMNSFAQEQTTSITTTAVDLKTNYTTEWVSYVDNEHFSIEYKFIDCDPTMGFDFQSVVLKFTNKTANNLKLNWHIDMYYDNVCKTCDYPVEYNRAIYLSPNESIEGTCSRDIDIALSMFSKFIDQSYTKGAHLTMFQLSNLTSILV